MVKTYSIEDEWTVNHTENNLDGTDSLSLWCLGLLIQYHVERVLALVAWD